MQVEPFFGTLWYDVIGRKRAIWRTGEHSLGDRVAIYLVYPTFGIQPSHLRSIAYLRENGFSVILVSNRPLSDADLQKLLPITTLVLQRPNFGYDFGGYRDGILKAQERRDSLRQLVLVNDSVWFPIAGGRNWLADIAGMQADFVGAVSNLALDTVEPDQVDAFKWNFNTRNAEFHYCSFALSFGPKILADGRFWRFWRRYLITRNKIETIRRGEVGLSQWIIKRGYRHGSTLSADAVEQRVRALSDDRLREFLGALIIPQEKALRDAVDAFIAEDRNRAWRERAEKVLLNTIARTGMSYVLPEFINREMEFPFLKKSPLLLDPAGKTEMLRFLKQLPEPLGTELLAEAERMIAPRR